MRPSTVAASAAAVVATVLAGCGGGTAAPAAPPATVTVEVPVSAPVPATPTTTAAPSSAAEPIASSWTMPDLVGMGLQDAQDTIQRLTGYGIAVTTSSDATGAGRLQVLDRNWKVCTQNVPPGAQITSGTSIDFGVVKLDEDC